MLPFLTTREKFITAQAETFEYDWTSRLENEEMQEHDMFLLVNIIFFITKPPLFLSYSALFVHRAKLEPNI